MIKKTGFKIPEEEKKQVKKMAKNKEIKTNAMRILEREKIPFAHFTYECEEFVDGIQVADMLGLPHEKVYKTLVTVGNSKNYFVFVLPIEAELDLKPMIFELELRQPSAQELDLTALVAAQNPSCNPQLLANAVELYLPELRPDFVRIRRLEIYDEQGNPFR